jgi:AcrR family transcriptional regulator
VAPGATKGDRTRRRLLDAAAAEAARHGPAGVSLGSIAAAAGLKTGSVYFHFASKEHLVATMLEEGLRESLRLLDEALATVPDSDDARARLRAAIRAHLGALTELDDYATVVRTPGAADDLPAAAESRSLRQAYARRWTALVEHAQRAGLVAADVDPRLVRDLLVGAMNSAAHAAGRPEWSPEETARAVEALLHLDR